MFPIAGVILQHETCYQKADNGQSLIQLLKDRDVICGVTLDQGLVPLYGAKSGETTTQGLDNLDARCKKYYEDGLRFAKWRGAFTIKGQDVSTRI